MPRATPMQTSFNAGEWAPELYGRIDMEKYQHACSLLENFIPLVQGPATRRPGLRFFSKTRDKAGYPNVGQYTGHLYQAPYSTGNNYFLAAIPNATTSSLELWSYDPEFPLSSVTDSAIGAGTADFDNLVIATSGDYILLCRPGFGLFSLLRSGSPYANYAITAWDTINGPFDDTNETTTTVYISARSGAALTATASAAIFTADHVGRKFRVENKQANAVPMWEAAKAVVANDLRRSDGKTYKALNSATTGTVKPTHFEGAEYDGNAGVQWEYQDAGWGYGIITAYGSPTSVTITTDNDKEHGGGLPFPSQCVGAGNPSTRWAFGALTPAGTAGDLGPTHICFFRNRLVLMRSSDRRVWMSVAGDFRNFADVNESGEVTADMAISITLESSSGVGINWLASTDNLIVGTPESEFVIREITTSDPLGPGNVKASAVSNYGSSRVQPLVVGSSVVFVSKSGKRLREITYDALSDGYKTRDLSVLAPHMVSSRITQLAWMNDPDNIIWAAQESGDLLALSYSQTENVMGWSRHKIGGNGHAVSIACVTLPQDAGGYADQLVTLVSRETLGGGGVEYSIEILDPIDARAAIGGRPFFDSYVSAGPGLTTITGLTHLIGRTVDIFLDGRYHPSRVVSVSGEVEVDVQYKLAYVGLPAPAILASMDIEAGSADGVAQSKTKRIARMAVRFLNTMGGMVGPSLDRLEDILYREYLDAMDSSPATFTGDKELAWPGGYERQSRVYYYTEQPFPVTIVGLIPRITTERD